MCNTWNDCITNESKPTDYLWTFASRITLVMNHNTVDKRSIIRYDVARWSCHMFNQPSAWADWNTSKTWKPGRFLNVFNIILPVTYVHLHAYNFWLVVWNIFYFSIYWEWSPQLANIFQRGWNHQPDFHIHKCLYTEYAHAASIGNLPCRALPPGRDRHELGLYKGVAPVR